MCLRESQRKKRKNDGEHEFKWIRWKEKYGDKNEGQWENQCRSQEPLQIPRRIDSGKSTPKHITVRTQIPKSTQSEKQPWRKDRPRAKGGSPDNSPSAALEARRSRVRSIHFSSQWLSCPDTLTWCSTGACPTLHQWVKWTPVSKMKSQRRRKPIKSCLPSTTLN